MLRPRALTLLETLLALGILLTGLVGVLSLFQAGLSHSRRSEQRMGVTYTGRELLRQRLHQLRDPAAYFALAPGTGPWQTVAGHSGLEMRWRVTLQELYSPGRALEQAFSPGDQKVLSNSARRLELQLRQGGESVSLLATAAEPLRSFAAAQPIVLQMTGPNPVAKDGTLEFTARCQAADGRDLDDLMLAWSVVPVDGVGTLETVARDGRRATFRNQTRRKNGAIRHSGGSCYVVAQASYAGQVREVRSPLIQLVGP